MHRRKPISSSSGLKMPPGPVGHPLLGSLLYLIGPLCHNPHRSLAALAETYGPIVFLRLGLTRAMVMGSSPSITHEALAKNDAVLAARVVPDNVCALSYGAMSMLFLPSSDKLWRQLHGLIGAGFSSSQALEAIRPILERRAHQLPEYLRACSSSLINIREVVNGMVLNIVSNILFSEDVVDLREQTTQTFKSLLEPVFEEFSKSSVSDAFPFLAPLEHLLGTRDRISTHLAKLLKFIIEK